MRLNLIIICFIVLFMPLSIAQTNCPDNFIIGDANADDLIDIQDVVFILNRLFLGGEVYCNNQNYYLPADTDANKKIDIADAVYLLHYLFQGGSAPGINDLTNIIGQESDDSPELEFLAINTEEISIDLATPLKVEGLPSTFWVIDSSDEKDIENCEVSAISGTGEVKPVFNSAWEVPHNLVKEPLEFVISADEVNINENYKLSVTCTDVSGKSDTEELDISISEAIENIQTCRSGIDVACSYAGSPTTTNDDGILCLTDCDYQDVSDGNYEPQGRCKDLKNILIKGKIVQGTSFVELDASSYNTAPEIQKEGFITEDTCHPVTPGGGSSPCFVKDMTILRKPQDALDGFNLEELFLTEAEQAVINQNIPQDLRLPLAPDSNNNNNIPLGPIEGWMKGTLINQLSPNKLHLYGDYTIKYVYLL